MSKFEIPSNFNKQIDEFERILHKFNKIHSLTNYKNIKEIVADSIKPLEFMKFYPRVAIDVGSGAGFPAIFLALILKDCTWTLFEPNLKKASFLSYVKVALDISNLSVKSEKIEASQPFIADLITSRALMKTKDLINLCEGFYDKNTQFLLYKGSSVESELDGVKAKIYNDKNRNYVCIGEKW